MLLNTYPHLKLLIVLISCFTAMMPTAAADNDENYDSLFNKGKTIVYKVNKIANADLSIKNFTQTSDGRLWAATNLGLYWYDGLELKREQDNNHNIIAPKGVRVMHLQGDKHSGLWIYTRNREIAFYDTKQKQYTVVDNTAQLEVLSIVIDDTNMAWFSTSKGLFFAQHENKKITLTKYLPAAYSIRTKALHIHDDYLYFYNGNKVYKNKIGGKDNIPEVVVSNVDDINEIFIDKSGTIWIGGSQSGLEKIGINNERNTVNPGIDVRGITQSNNGVIWVASENFGLYAYDPISNKEITHITKKSSDDLSINSDYIESLFLDRSGLLWIGTHETGINYVNTMNNAYKNLSTSMKDSKHLVNNSIFYLLSVKSGDIWVGHSKNGITVLNRHGEFKHHYETEFDSGTVYAMVEDKDGLIWILVNGGQIHKIDPVSKRVESMREDDLMLSPKNFNIIFDHDNRIFVSGRRGIFKYSPKTRSLLRVNWAKSSLTEHYNIAHSFVDSDGNSWFGGRKLIAYIARGSNEAKVVWISESEKKYSKSLFTTQSGIIYTIIGDQLFKLSLDRDKADLTLNPVKNLKPVTGRFYKSEDGNLWASHFHIDTSSGDVNQLGYADGILADLDRYYARLKLSDGTQIHGSSTGLIFFRPQLYQKWNYTPPLHIDEILFDDKRQNENSSEITIGTDVSRVKFTYSSLDYSYPINNRYAYRLLGYQDDWVEQGIEGRQITFTNLDPGHYVMEFKGSDRNGVWSNDEKRIKVHVLPHWYETVWFRGLVGLILLVLIWLSFQWRLRHLRQRQRQLEAQVTDRTKELSHSLHELNITKNQLVESEKQASLGRLVRGVAHELNTPIGIVKSTASGLSESTRALNNAFTAGTLSPTELQNFLALSENSSQLIESNIDRMSRLTTDFKEISADEAHGSVHEITLKSLFQSINTALVTSLEKQGVNVVFEVDSNLRINTNEYMLRKAIIEIVENCAHHGFPTNPPSSNIDINTNTDTDTDTSVNKNISIKARAWQSSGVKLMIADNGIGMAENVRTEIFEPFFTTSSESEKIGLGLHSVFNWVTQSLRGQIVCRSQEGKGSCFILTLKAFDGSES